MYTHNNKKTLFSITNKYIFDLYNFSTNELILTKNKEIPIKINGETIKQKDNILVSAIEKNVYTKKI